MPSADRGYRLVVLDVDGTLGEEVKYDLAEYPETVRLLADSLVIGSYSYPLFPQAMELMRSYVEAVQRVFTNLDQVIG